MSEWKIVPIEPTRSMVAHTVDAVFDGAIEDCDIISEVYRTMLDAAPPAPFPLAGEPVGEIVGTEKRGFALMTVVRWEPGFNRVAVGTKLYAAPPPAADAVSEAMTDAALNAWWGGDYWRDDEDSVVAESRRSMRAAIAAALAARGTK
jgi:hypothetical protein